MFGTAPNVIVGRATFPQAARLKHQSEFKSLLRKGRSLRRSGVVLYYAARQAGGPSRLGVMVSKRVLKRAAMRNRVKRLAREFFRTQKTNFRAPHDALVRIVRVEGRLDGAWLRAVLTKLFQDAGVMVRGSGAGE